MLSRLVYPLYLPSYSNLPVRLANRLKALSITAYSSDEDDDSSTAHGSETSPKRGHPTNGMAFAEVVRATMRAKEDAAAPAATESKAI